MDGDFLGENSLRSKKGGNYKSIALHLHWRGAFWRWHECHLQLGVDKKKQPPHFLVGEKKDWGPFKETAVEKSETSRITPFIISVEIAQDYDDILLGYQMWIDFKRFFQPRSVVFLGGYIHSLLPLWGPASFLFRWLSPSATTMGSRRECYTRGFPTPDRWKKPSHESHTTSSWNAAN